jgi:hypothetical protein
MPQPSPYFHAQSLSSPPHPPQAPSRAAGGAIYTVSSGPVRSLQGWPTLRGAYHATLGGRSPHRTDNPHCSLPPISASPCCQMSCGVVGRRVSIVSKVSGSQSSRVNGSQGLSGFKGTKNLRVSRSRGIEGLLRLTGAF